MPDILLYFSWCMSCFPQARIQYITKLSLPYSRISIFNFPLKFSFSISINYLGGTNETAGHLSQVLASGRGKEEAVCLRVTAFFIIGKPAVRVRGTLFMPGVDTGYCRLKRIRRRETLFLSLKGYGDFMPASNQFFPSKHSQRQLCNLNLNLSFCAKASFSLLQILRDSSSKVPFALIILTQNF